MCGLFGIVGEFIDRGKVSESLNTLYHRGPDQNNIIFKDNVALGHRRLSILDLSENGKQPMHDDEQQIYITINGEIYNYLSIKESLKKTYHFKSTSDSEVVLYAYKQYGLAKMLEMIDGMFAIVIYDRNINKLFIIRDRVGIKPLYFGIHDKFISWASELKAIEKYVNPNLEIDNTAIYDYLTYLYIPAPKTKYKNVFKLKPAHYIEIDTNNLNIKEHEYWSVDLTKESKININEAGEEIRRLIKKSVKQQMISDVPIGFFLSGGIDSSIVVREASQLSDYINTFSIGYKETEHSEIQYADIIANKYKTIHHTKILEEEKACELIMNMANWYDEPYADTSAIPTYMVSEFAKQNVTVVLTGDGGDELFGGYQRYFDFIKYPNFSSNSFLNYHLLKLRRRYNYKLAGKIANRCLNYLLVNMPLYTKFQGGMLKEEKNKFKKSLGIFKDYNDYWYFDEFIKNSPVNLKSLQYLDFKTYLPDDILTKVDRVSMAVSLESRVPLLSKDIIEFCFSLPESILYYNNQLKGLIKYAYKDIIPDTILFRKKAGFNIPLHKWDLLYKNKNKYIQEILLEEIYKT